jgi:hypothetical protein
MKKLFVALLLLSQSSFAIIVEVVEQFTMIEPSCPMCTGGPEVTTTTIHFSHVSCANMEGSFYLKIEGKQMGFQGELETFVSVAMKEPVMDCMGPTHMRDYSLSTKELKRDQRYILGNPSRLAL